MPLQTPNQTFECGCLRLLTSLLLIGVLPGTGAAQERRACGIESSSARVVFDSNRSGSFGIYSVKLDGAGVRTVIDTPADEMHPEVSPDGALILFASHRRPSDKRGSVWLVPTEGGSPRQIVSHGAFPTFDRAGQRVVFERNRRTVFAVSLDGTGEVEIFPGVHKFRHEVVMPRLSADGQSVAFTSDKGGRWNSWVANLATGALTLIGRGCEPTWFQRSGALAWVAAGKSRGGAGIFSFEPATSRRAELLDRSHPFGHEYFPSLALDDTVLLYAAAPEGQHDHATSNYQLFVRHLSTGCGFRLLNDRFTNRWPKWLADSR